MDFIVELLVKILNQFQSPSLAFLIAGVAIAALKSRLRVPDAVYEFIIFMLLMRIGLKGGMEIRDANLVDMLLPALFSFLIGIFIVLLGVFTLSKLPNVKREDGIATAGLFGAVSASTLAAAMLALEEQDVFYEAWVPALYPFMDIPALILAIVLANLYINKKNNKTGHTVRIWPIVKDSLRGSALSALILGIILGLLTDVGRVYESFYNPLFKGFLSVLMLVMGIEAYSRLHELKQVAHWYAVYAAIAPIVHGLVAFGLGYIAYVTVGFSPGGVILLAVLAASNSDISGPPTLRAGIPSANPSSYIGASTSVGTPIAIAICIPLFIALAEVVFKY